LAIKIVRVYHQTCGPNSYLAHQNTFNRTTHQLLHASNAELSHQAQQALLEP